jgi:hypothetical protein
VPPGYRLAQASRGDGTSLLSNATFVPAVAAVPGRVDTDHGNPHDGQGRPTNSLRLELLVPANAGDYGGAAAGTGTKCPDFPAAKYDPTVTVKFSGICYRWLPDHKHLLMALGRLDITKDDLLQFLDSAEVADPDRTGTWFPADRAFPASAQVGAK